MDEETEQLILKLLEEDVTEIQSHDDYYQFLGPLDVGCAIQTHKAEVEKALLSLSDQRMCRSIDRAAREDGALLDLTRNEERLAAADHRMAASLSGRPAQSLPNTDVDEVLSDDPVQQPTAINTTSDEISDSEGSISSTQIDKTEAAEVTDEGERMEDTDPLLDVTNRPELETTESTEHFNQCTACLEQIATCETLNAPCMHNYCKTCIQTLCKDAITDQTLFPPRCCGLKFEDPMLCAALEEDLMQKLEEKAIEIETLDRTYCSKTTCSVFLMNEADAYQNISCDECGQKTCSKCKLEAHTGDCEVKAEEPIWTIAKEMGWQQCYKCKALVELTIGCNHMKCICGGQFCYECGKQWKRCGCEQWVEGRLLDRAQEIADRNPQPGAPQDLAAIARRIRAQHDCEHPREWTWIEGRNQCDRCTDWLREFIFECPDCLYRACLSCKNNRL